MNNTTWAVRVWTRLAPISHMLSAPLYMLICLIDYSHSGSCKINYNDLESLCCGLQLIASVPISQASALSRPHNIIRGKTHNSAIFLALETRKAAQPHLVNPYHRTPVSSANPQTGITKGFDTLARIFKLLLNSINLLFDVLLEWKPIPCRSLFNK